MPRRFPRRTFLSMTALTVAATTRWSRAALATPGAREGEHEGEHADRVRVRPFALSAVRLRAGAALEALEVNRRYLMALDTDRLLHMFRITAGLPSTAQPLGGWEAPDNELRGHFSGHYLSACALLAAQTGDAAVRDRGTHLAAELARCQAAIGTGYLSAFPVDLFDRLRAGQPAWAPFYTLHKIMAGLLDTYTLSGERQALDTLLGMARWTERWVQPLSDAEMARVLEREYGGMNELLYNLAAATSERRWRELAQRFDRKRILTPLAAGRDELQGLHANTTIPQIIGAARGYELTGDPRAAARGRDLLGNRHAAADVLHRRNEQRRELERAARGAGARALRIHRGVLRHLQHAEADAAAVWLERRPASRRLLRTRPL
jgi:DUF1680 family protein